MSTLQGNAKKYSGVAIDYVLLFDWVTGVCIGKAVPDASGVWTYDYYQDLLCGIAYVADGCQPITHGAYSFIADAPIFGYLALIVASTAYNPDYDKTAVGQPNWSDDFSRVMDIGLHNYTHNSGTAIAVEQTKIVNSFDIKWRLLTQFYIGLAPTDDISLTLELLDDDLLVLGAIKIARLQDNSVAIWYGTSLSQLTRATVVTEDKNDFAVVDGIFSFTKNGVSYQNTWTSGGTWTPSFDFVVNLTRLSKARIVSSAKSTATGGAVGYLKIIPPAPVQ